MTGNCVTSLPHLEHELEDVHVCSQSCWDKYSDRHRCRALIFFFVCTGWELLNSNLKAVNFCSSLAYFDLKHVKSKPKTVKACNTALMAAHIQGTNTTLRAFANDSSPVRQRLCFASLLWQYRCVAGLNNSAKLCNVERETAISALRGFQNASSFNLNLYSSHLYWNKSISWLMFKQ